MVITVVISIVGLVTIVITSISWDIGIDLILWYICLVGSFMWFYFPGFNPDNGDDTN